jgi:hypothetical protein
MRRIIGIFLLLAPLALAGADVTKVTAQADDLHDKGMYADARKLVLDAVSGASGKDQAELYWRAARETLELGDAAGKAKRPQGEILDLFTAGEGYADKAIAADPQNDLGLYWKASNIGRWGQTRGVLNSLFKAGPMRELLVKELGINANRSDAYYVLGQLYRELPGVISFGNVDYAVSLGREARDLRASQFASGAEKDLQYNFVTELAKSLYKRNWTAAARASGQKTKASKAPSAKTPEEMGFFYEGTVTLPSQSDREEALALAKWVVSEIEKHATRTAQMEKDLVKAQDVLKEWQGS